MRVLTFPSALHICPACERELATGMDSFGKPRRCYDCQAELMQFVGAAKRLRILPADEKPRYSNLFKVATFAVCLVAFAVLSAIGWMLR